ncbi:MAG: hypothetical protein R3178_08450 [Rhodothermales bacterium]|nr:hypothetical protein [Rhodothermales bacterium]
MPSHIYYDGVVIVHALEEHQGAGSDGVPTGPQLDYIDTRWGTIQTQGSTDPS